VQSGLEPTQSSYGAVVYMVAALQSQYVLVLTIVAGYVLARSWRGMLGRTRRVTFDNAMLLWHYAVAQGMVGLLLVHAFPRIVG
jgi:cytochrome c oxidase subunit I+III